MNVPDSGDRNRWLMEVAARGRHYMPPEKMSEFLNAIARMHRWGDRDFPSEIARAIGKAYSSEGYQKEDPLDTSINWPAFDQSVWDRRSQHPDILNRNPSQASTEEIFDLLYAPDALICMATTVSDATTRERSFWKGKEQFMSYLVANPMRSFQGITKEGNPSFRCLENACIYRDYLVVEFDRGRGKEQASVLSSLHSEVIPLVLVTFSGSKSLHGWFYVRGVPERQVRLFFKGAVLTGADKSLWDNSKLVRVPGGRRYQDDGPPILQQVFHFDPDYL